MGNKTKVMKFLDSLKSGVKSGRYELQEIQVQKGVVSFLGDAEFVRTEHDGTYTVIIRYKCTNSLIALTARR